MNEEMYNNLPVIPNGSFEEISICPVCGGGDIAYVRVKMHIKAICRECGETIKFVKQWQNDADWSKEVKERAKYTCQRCGAHLTSHQAHAHHKIPKWFMPELQYDLNNGICLCNACHKQVHGKDGTIKEGEDECPW